MKKYSFLFFVIMSFLCVFQIPISASAETKISVDQIVTESTDLISVPIRIEGNTGMCGAALSIKYDKNLILTSIEKGEALPSLTLTKSAELSSNPQKLVWDGIDSDSTNGVIAKMYFKVPEKCGTYNVEISYEQGDIVDGNLDPIKINTKSGTITVEEPQKINVNISGKQVLIGDSSNSDQKVIISYFDDQGLLKSIKTYPVADEIQDEANQDASFAKVMLWNSLTKMRPMCTTETVNLR